MQLRTAVLILRAHHEQAKALIGHLTDSAFEDDNAVNLTEREVADLALAIQESSFGMGKTCEALVAGLGRADPPSGE